MRYAIVNTSGQAKVVEELVHLPSRIETSHGIIHYDPESSGQFNWQATRLARERLMPDDRLFGVAFLTGAPRPEGGYEDVPQESLDLMHERAAARGV